MLGRVLPRAMICGSMVGSFCCERFGVEALRTLTWERIDERCHAFRRLTEF